MGDRVMASIGVIISIAVASTGLWLACQVLGFELSLPWALVFGALISPTDPVAVLGLLKTVNVPESIKAKIAGEALFNDGAAVVAFAALLGIALGVPGHPAGEVHESLWSIAGHFLFQGFGGILFGLVTGWIAYRAMAAVDDPMVEILISIGVCAATYALSLRLNVSGPIAVVVTGLLIGNHGAEHAMSEKVQEYLFSFWEVIDELLNSVLFLLIGLEVLVLASSPPTPGSCSPAFRSCLPPGWYRWRCRSRFCRSARASPPARFRSSPGAACAAASRWRWRCRCPEATPSR